MTHRSGRLKCIDFYFLPHHPFVQLEKLNEFTWTDDTYTCMFIPESFGGHFNHIQADLTDHGQK